MIAIHGASLAALQEQSRETVIDSVPVPPAGPKTGLEVLTSAWHRTPDGAVRLVELDAELPHAAEPNSVPVATASTAICRVLITSVGNAR